MTIKSHTSSTIHDESLFEIICCNKKSADKINFDREKILLILKKIINNELTPRQKECLLFHYCEKKALTEIAHTLNIHVSTVCRHIKKAKNRIYKTLSYSFPRFS
ncbi:MAG: hypothetical protein LBJ95_03810 [Oscillospiraceae bacterium]|jgi:RNA polymerase sigma factor (sigma-70 family)|nr:hypothetical protein [Oscillospiraceae bacterium]